MTTHRLTSGEPKPETPKPIKGLVKHEDAMRVMARRFTPMALHTLLSICEKSSNDGARVSAAKEILDRAWGRVPTAKQQEAQQTATNEITVVFGKERATIPITPPPQQLEHSDPDDHG